jgi:hypothetical protein
MNATKRTICAALGAFLATLPQAASAYETPVHAAMTRFAFQQSVKDRDFLKDLAVPHVFDASGNLLTEPILGNGVVGWAMYGSVVEDSFIRSLFHFYDPLAATGSQGLFGVFQAAPDWAFSTTVNSTYSLPGTRDSLYNALTNTDTLVRPKQLRDTFRGVGQFTHLLEDMAQPQHVRNDDHFSLTEQFYYLFPDYSRYEKRTLFLNDNGQLNFGGYPSVKLPTYRSYWNTGDDKGLAQATNLNYVSEGTNLDTGRYGSPLGTLLNEEVIPEVRDVFGNLVDTNVTVQYVTYTYTDNYINSPVVNDRLSTYSLFDFQRMQLVNKHMYTLYNTNHDRYAQLLVPRAVGYSAGLIDRFFRGSLEITPPDENVYSVVDHSAIHQTDALNGFVGFGKVKLKVRNATPGGEQLTGGRLVAVAKFHRNGCYKDDLSGEFKPPLQPACPDYRTDTEEIVVSNAFDNQTLDSTNPAPYTFTFAQQIPINATDLQIQVVYRGALGTDPDEVVAGAVDVFEPTYFSVYNTTDQILFNGVFKDTTDPSLLPTLDTNPQDGVIDVQYDRTNLDVRFGFTPQFTATPLATVIGLPPARYARVAILTDRDPYPVPIQTNGTLFFTSSIQQYDPITDQIDLKQNSYIVSELEPLRGVQSWDSLTLHRFFGSPSTGDLATLPDLTDKTPFPITTLNF